MNNKFKKITLIFLVMVMTVNLTGVFVYANPDWGKNTFDFGKDLAWWAALTAIVVFAVKFIAKRAWVQLAGFLALGGIILVIIDDPTRLKNIALTVWNFIFK